MKRFLIAFTLIVFSAVSCAGPNKVRWTRTGSDFRQDKFEEDRTACIQSIDPGLHSEAFGQALEECLAWKSYKYEPGETGSSKQALKKGRMEEWGKPDFSPVQFEEDQQECKQAILNDIEHPVTVAECLAKKGYTFASPLPEKKERASVVTVLGVTAGIALIVGLLVITNGAAAPFIYAAGMCAPKN